MSAVDQMTASRNVSTPRGHTTVAVRWVLLSTLTAGAAMVFYISQLTIE